MSFNNVLNNYNDLKYQYSKDLQDLINLEEGPYSQRLKKSFTDLYETIRENQKEEILDFLDEINEEEEKYFIYNNDLYFLHKNLCKDLDKIKDHIRLYNFFIDDNTPFEDSTIENDLKELIRVQGELIKHNIYIDQTIEIVISKNISLLYNFNNVYEESSPQMAYDILLDLKKVKSKYIKTYQTDQKITVAKLDKNKREITSQDDYLLIKYNIASFINAYKDSSLLTKFLNPKERLPLFKDDFQIKVMGYSQTQDGINLLNKADQYLENKTAESIYKNIINISIENENIKEHFSFAIRENVIYVRSSGLVKEFNTLQIMRDLLHHISKVSKQSTNTIDTIVFDISNEKYNNYCFEVPFIQIEGLDPKLFDSLKNIEHAIDYVKAISREELKTQNHLKFQYKDFKRFDKRNNYEKIPYEKTLLALNKKLNRDVMVYKRTDLDTRPIYKYLGYEYKIKTNPIITFKNSRARGIKAIDMDTNEDVIIYDINSPI